MNSTNQMTALYTELAPQFLIYLKAELEKLEGNITRLVGPNQDDDDPSEASELLDVDSEENPLSTS